MNTQEGRPDPSIEAAPSGSALPQAIMPRVDWDGLLGIANGDLPPIQPRTIEQAYFSKSVIQELDRLRARTEAKRLFDLERQGEGQPFDAGLMSEIKARPPEPPMRISGLQPWSSNVLLVAQHKTGKTSLGANYARALLLDEPFLGRFPVIPLTGKIAVLNYEVSGAQLVGWFDDVGVPLDRCFQVNLRGRRNPLSSATDRAQLAELLREAEVEAVIVDPFSRAFTGTNQNDVGEVGAWLSDLEVFVRSEVGATDLLLMAHAGWNGDRARGSTGLVDWADAIWTMTRDEAGTRFFSANGRDVDLDEDQLVFDPETRRLSVAGIGGRKESRKHQQLEELAAKALAIIAAEPGITSGAISEKLTGGQRNDRFAAIKYLVEQGKIYVEPGPNNKRLHFVSGSNGVTSSNGGVTGTNVLSTDPIYGSVLNTYLPPTAGGDES